MNLSKLFIIRPIATSLLALAVVIMGAIAYAFLPVAPLPNVAYPVITVTASLSGASPENMSTTVATPLERALGSIAGVTDMSSTSSDGSTRIILFFDFSKDINDAARDVQAAINATRPSLPSALKTPPTYKKVDPSSASIMSLALTSDTLDQGKLYDLASTILAQKISQISGVGDVTVGGSSLPAVRVDINPTLLNSFGIALDKVRTALSGANSTQPKGYIENSQYQWQVNTNDQLKKAVDYKNLIVSWSDGKAVRLGDVAHVYDSVESIYNSGFYNRQKAIILMIRRQGNANIIDTVDAVKAQLPVLQALIPAQADLSVAQDRSPSIRATLHDAELTLIIAIILVTLVVLLFLQHLRATLIPAISVPISLMGTLAFMYFFNYSLNTISLMALIVATGFVVDDSIVVLENIMRHIEKGMSPLRASLKGAKEVGFTVLSMSLSLVAVFIPILLMSGVIGRMFREFAVTLSIAIGVSLVVSLTVTPMLCAQFLSHKQFESKPNAIGRWWNSFFRLLQGFYGRTLRWALRHRFITLMILLLTIGLNVHLYKIVPKGLFPQQDTGQVVGVFKVDQGTSFQAMIPKLEAFRTELLKDPAVEHVMGYAGGRGGSNSSFLQVQLKPFDERTDSATDVVNRLRNKFNKTPGAQLFLVPQQDIRVGGGGGGSGSYDYALMSGDLSLLKEWTPKIALALGKVPELVDVSSSAEDKGRRLSLKIDREALNRLGISVSTVASTLNSAFSQRRATVIYNELNQYQVVMQVAPQFMQDAQALNLISLVSDSGQVVPLSAVAHFETENAPLSVKHQGLQATNYVSFNLASGISLEQASAAINDAVARSGMPTNQIQGSFIGSAQLFQQSMNEQPFLILAALITMYLVLGILYESYIHPITILSTLPSAGVGAVLALLMLKTEFSIIALIGVFLLIGIVKKNAIMMVDFALHYKRENNVSSEIAIFRSCLVRFRPILMTTFAAMLGALPLIFATGAGVELRQPLGITIVGGLLLSQILTLYTTPVIYLYLDSLSNWFKKRRETKLLEKANS